MAVFNTLNETDLAVLASKRLKMAGKSLLTLQSFIPNALNDLAQEVANNPKKRHLLMTDPNTVTASITSLATTFGVYADLSTPIDTYGVMLDKMRLGTVFYTGPAHTFESTDVTGRVIVAGAGTDAANGTYELMGQTNSLPHYNLDSDALSFNSAVYWFIGSEEWKITNSSGSFLYDTGTSFDSFPWEPTPWIVQLGSAPVPTVTEGASTVTVTGHGYQTGQAVTLSTTGTLPGGLSPATTYYLIRYDADQIGFATSAANAHAEDYIPFSDLGDGVATITPTSKSIAQWLTNPNQGLCTPSIPVDYTYIWLQQNRLYTSAATGTFSFMVPYQPVTLSQLPAQLTNDLVDCLVNIALTAGFRPVNDVGV